MYVETELLEKGILLDNINIIKNLINQHFIPSDGEIKNSITYLKQLFEDYNITNIYFDATLARGLDYYTGIIFEINIDGFSSSVGGGGRYDNIITSYNNKLNIPMIGISFGLDRLLNTFNKYIIEKLYKNSKEMNTPQLIMFLNKLLFQYFAAYIVHNEINAILIVPKNIFNHYLQIIGFHLKYLFPNFHYKATLNPLKFKMNIFL